MHFFHHKRYVYYHADPHRKHLEQFQRIVSVNDASGRCWGIMLFAPHKVHLRNLAVVNAFMLVLQCSTIVISWPHLYSFTRWKYKTYPIYADLSIQAICHPLIQAVCYESRIRYTIRRDCFDAFKFEKKDMFCASWTFFQPSSFRVCISALQIAQGLNYSLIFW